MKIRFFSNIPSPYRIEFFNLLGEKIDLEVIFEAKKAPLINEKWYMDNNIKHFKAIFLKKGVIEEKRINYKVLKYVKKDTDLLIFTNYSYFTEMIALFYAKFRRINYALEIDGGIISKNENLLKRKLKKFLVSGAKLYLSPSKISDEFLIFYGAKKEKIYRYPFTSLRESEVLTNPIPEKEKILLRKEKQIKEEKVILSIGQFIPRKGFDWMIKAYKDLDSNIGIYIIGGKAIKEYIELKRQYKMNNLHFIDYQSKSNILKWLQLADVFVLPTREDIWGLVINEAMAQGLPVITTNKCIAGLELVKNDENGFIVDVDDKKDLVNRTINILDNKFKNIPMNNLKVMKYYTLENMVITTYEILESFLGKS